MYEISVAFGSLCRGCLQRKLFLIMKLSFLLLLACLFQANASSYAQQVTLHSKGASLVETLKEIGRQSGYNVFYDARIMEKAEPVTIQGRNIPLLEALQECFAHQNLTYAIEEKTIIVKDKAALRSIETPRLQQVVSGQVVDVNGNPLAGVSIVVKGSKNGTTTDSDGKYTLRLNTLTGTLRFTLIGYTAKESAVEGGTFDVILDEQASDLDEVVVVGYGTQAKKDLTGSIATVSGDDITKRSTSNLSNALQGAVPGLSATRGSSAPGNSSSLLLRGMTTLEGSSDPLILVDDVPVQSIDDVNPDQIESISVLKDGASAAIYGSRAAAGVIIITTKRAKTNVFSVNYNGELLFDHPTTMPGTVSPVRYMEMYNEYMWNDAGNGTDEYPAYAKDLIVDYSSLHLQHPDQYPITDWPNLLLKDYAPGYRHSITLSGGTDKVKTIASFGYDKQNALYDNRTWERYTARINNDVKFNDKFGALFDFSFRTATSDQPIIDPTSAVFRYAPIYAATWSDGRIAEGKQGDNIYAMLHEGGLSSNNTYKLFGKAGVFYKPLKGLKISANIAPRFDFTRFKEFNNTIPYWAYDDPTKTQSPKYISGHNDKQANLTENRDFYRTLTTQGFVNYDTSIGDHNLSGVVGFETFQSETEDLNLIGKEYISNDYPYLNQAPVDKVYDNGSSLTELAYASYFGRLEYNYKNTYYLQGNVRRDASSRFSSKYRWGTFPSISAGWVLSNESFFKAVKIPISFAKIRASYGSLGNDRLGNYLYLSTMQFMNALFANGRDVVAQRAAAQRFLAIEDITWETTTSFDLGFDLALLDNKVSLNADYYWKKTKNMLLNVSIPMLSGYENPMDNVGGMNTKGWEIAATWKDHIGDLHYAVSFNLFDSKSIIGDIKGKRILGSSTLSEQGTEYNAWYGYKADGLYQSQAEADESATTSGNIKAGDIKYVDISGPDGTPDGMINEWDRTFLGGSTLPRYQYGGKIELGYKNFDFGMTLQGVGKQKAYVGQNYTRPFNLSWESPPAIIDGNYWSAYHTAEENAAARYPRLSQNSVNNNYVFSDYWLINGAYLRVKNLTLGYTLPKSFLNRVGFSNLRIYITGNDLFSISDFPKGIDPEYNGGYLITKSYIFGVNLRF